ncbi:tRNA pseudouridine(55) synthase TruB [Microbacteriaceae bacterium VKM Ac-2854]|nr:tRNA pseudouridine(55) synthase TruB [Microbacteriaceae bacterium VKM Ac-2854]
MIPNGRAAETAPSGILLLDKPGGITSHDLVARTRRRAGTRKVGHAGTLDPMATGLMILGVGSSTRLLTFVVGLGKTYEATIRLGESTVTDDKEGESTGRADVARVAEITAEQIDAGIAALTGDILQVPSSVSAIKIDGKRSYARVRSGEEVEIPARPVTVSEFTVLDRRIGDGLIDLDVRVTCSSGTYIRALARDLGAGLGIGGHLTALRRTRIGPFSVAEAGDIDQIEVAEVILAPTRVARALFDAVELGADEAVDLANGKRVPAPDAPRGVTLAAIGPGERLVGLAERRGDTLKTVVNFPPDAA